jgi:hypothetical protein
MKPFARLRAEMKYHDIDEAYLGERLGRSHKYISERLMAKAPWTMDEVYTILDLINWPTEKMHEIFPPRRSAFGK